jgi:hypothetical protein
MSLVKRITKKSGCSWLLTKNGNQEGINNNHFKKQQCPNSWLFCFSPFWVIKGALELLQSDKILHF